MGRLISDSSRINVALTRRFCPKCYIRHPAWRGKNYEITGLGRVQRHVEAARPRQLRGGALQIVLRQQHLRQAGVPVRHQHYPGAIHACLHFTRLSPTGWQLMADLAQWLRERRDTKD